MVISDLIKDIRKKNILSQEELAKELGVSFSTVNRWETGKTFPNFKTMKKIKAYCDECGINFDISEEKSVNY